MLRLCVSLACFVCLVLTGARAQSGMSCPTSAQRSVTFSVVSRKNQVGQWVAEVEMKHDGSVRDAAPWRADIQHSTTGCAGAQVVKLSARLSAPPPRPGPGYELYRGFGYYKLHTDKMTWSEAKRTCEKEGAHLAIINSEAESKVLQEMFAREPTGIIGDWALVGFHDQDTEGRFVTIFDEPVNATGFTRWSSAGQPDNMGVNPGEDCGSIHRNGGINDISCQNKYPFFCEQEVAEI